jgi:hypothetical protein
MSDSHNGLKHGLIMIKNSPVGPTLEDAQWTTIIFKTGKLENNHYNKIKYSSCLRVLEAQGHGHDMVDGNGGSTCRANM